MNQKQVSEVPNPGNDLTYIMQTAPGVVMNTDLSNGSHFSILGMPANSYLLTTDGMSNGGPGNDTITGALGLLLGQNEIQEATVVSTGYSGQFGGAAGGNIITSPNQAPTAFTETRNIIGTAAHSTPTIGLITLSMFRGPSVLPISGPPPWEDRLRRINCFSFLIAKVCVCRSPPPRWSGFPAISLKTRR